MSNTVAPTTTTSSVPMTPIIRRNVSSVTGDILADGASWQRLPRLSRHSARGTTVTGPRRRVITGRLIDRPASPCPAARVGSEPELRQPRRHRAGSAGTVRDRVLLSGGPETQRPAARRFRGGLEDGVITEPTTPTWFGGDATATRSAGGDDHRPTARPDAIRQRESQHAHVASATPLGREAAQRFEKLRVVRRRRWRSRRRSDGSGRPERHRARQPRGRNRRRGWAGRWLEDRSVP